MPHPLNEGGGQTAGVVLQLPPAGGTVEHPGPAAPAEDVTCRAAGDGQGAGDGETDGTLHQGLQLSL